MRIKSMTGVQHNRTTGEQHVAHPPLRGTMHKRGNDQTRQSKICRQRTLTNFFGRGDASTECATERGKEDVFVAPHHTLGHSCGSTGVEEVQVVASSPVRKRCVGLRVDKFVVRLRPWRGMVRTVFHHNKRADFCEFRTDFVDDRCKSALEDNDFAI